MLTLAGLVKYQGQTEVMIDQSVFIQNNMDYASQLTASAAR